MNTACDSRTSTTLLGRLCRCPSDQAAWSDFVARYGGRIFGWCRRWGLTQPDAEDVTQDVLFRLHRKMRRFIYRPAGSFRGWLRTLAEHAWKDFVQQRRAALPGGVCCLESSLSTVEAREDLLQRLAEEFDLELLEEAKARVRLRVQPRTWGAFELYVLEGRSVDEVSAQLAMNAGTVYVSAHRVQQALVQEVRSLEACQR